MTGCTTVQTNTNAVSNTNVANTNVVVDTNENANITVTNDNINTDQASEVDTSDWLTYTNEEYGFSFKYPSDWTVKQLDDKTLGLVSSELQVELDNGPTSINNSDLMLNIYKPSTSAPFMTGNGLQKSLEKVQEEKSINNLVFLKENQAKFTKYNDFAATNQYGQYIQTKSDTIITAIYGMNLDKTTTLEAILSSLQ